MRMGTLRGGSAARIERVHPYQDARAPSRTLGVSLRACSHAELESAQPPLGTISLDFDPGIRQELKTGPEFLLAPGSWEKGAHDGKEIVV